MQRAAVRSDDVDEYDIVSSDARLARIMQEQERLDAIMRREQKRIRRAQRERERQQREQQQLQLVGVRAINHYHNKCRSDLQ